MNYEKIDISKLDNVKLVEFRTSLKNEIAFYHKMLEEEYRINHPDSQRYSQAKKNIEQINTLGKSVMQEILKREIPTENL